MSSQARELIHATDNSETEHFFIERISGYGLDDENRPLFQRKWYGLSSAESTREPQENIDYNTAVRYCRRSRIPIPDESPRSSGIGLDN